MKFTDEPKHRCFITSDSHYNHNNIIKYSLRTFCLNDYEKAVFATEDVETINAMTISKESMRKHDEALIQNWNSKVRPEDTVFHLGDFALGGDVEYAASVLRRLNGKINYIEGNHDKVIKKIWENRVSFGVGGKLVSYDQMREISINGQGIVLCHYAMRIWHKSHHGYWMLFGHSHGTLPDDPNAKSFDVGVDCHNYFPISIGEVSEIMNRKKFKPIDHHDRNTN